MARGTSGVMLKMAALEQSLREAGGFEVYNWVFLRPSKTFEQFINTPLPALNGKTLIEMITPTPQTVRQMRIDFDIGNLSGILVPIQRALAIRSADGELELSPEAVIKMYPAGIAPAAAAAGPAAVQQPRAQSPAAPAAAPPRAPIPAAAVGAAMPPGAAQMGAPQHPVPEAPAVAPSPGGVRGTQGVVLTGQILTQSFIDAGLTTGSLKERTLKISPNVTFEQLINTPLSAFGGYSLKELMTQESIKELDSDFRLKSLTRIADAILPALGTLAKKVGNGDDEWELSRETLQKMRALSRGRTPDAAPARVEARDIFGSPAAEGPAVPLAAASPLGVAPSPVAAGPAAVQQPGAQSPAAAFAAAQMGAPQRPVPVGPAAVQQPRAQGPAAAVAAAPVRPGSPIPAAAPARVNRKALFDELSLELQSLELQKLPLEGRVNTMLNMPLVHLGNRTLRDMGISGQDVGGWINSGGSLFAIGIANRAADTAEALAAAPPRRAASPGGRAPSPAVAGPAAGGFPGPARPGLDKEAFKQELAGFLTLLGNQPGRVNAIGHKQFTALGGRTPEEVGIGWQAIDGWLQQRPAAVAIQDLDRFVDQVAYAVDRGAPARAPSPDAVRRSPSPAAQQPRAQGPAAAVAAAPVRPGSPIPAAAPAIVYKWGLFDELSRKLKSLKPGGRVNTMLNMPLVELGNRTLKDMGISSKDVDGWINRGGSLLAIVNRAAEAAARDDVADLLKTMHRIKKREGFGKTAEIHDLTFRGRPLQEALGDQFDVPRWLQASADREPGIEGRLKRVLAAPSPAAAAAAVRHRSPSPVAAQVDVRRAPTPPPTPPDPQQRRGWGSWLWGRQ